MAWHNALWFILAALITGCPSVNILNDPESQAQRHMAIADTLERTFALEKATIEYALVAEHYPSTSVHATAVRKAALLYSSPLNPSANDSAARYWLSSYLKITPSQEEKQIILMYLAMVERVKTLRDSLILQAAINDSLAFAVRKTANESTARARRVQDLEVELQKAADELKKLKEIDVRISKSRGKNKP